VNYRVMRRNMETRSLRRAGAVVRFFVLATATKDLQLVEFGLRMCWRYDA
jgi:hypothetical protein